MRSVLAVTAAAAAAAAAVPWTTCPPTELGGHANECASLPLPLDPTNATSPTITYFVRRYFAGAAATAKSVWMLDGGPGFSAVAFAPIAQYIVNLDPSVTVYIPDQRGVGLSSPVTCASPPTAAWFDPGNATSVASFDACNQDIVRKYGTTAAFYSTYNAAQDLLAAIEAVNPAVVGIYALSYGTFVTNTYLQLPNARADVVVLDGPVPPNRWVLENNAAWVSIVARDVLHECARLSAACSTHLGDLGQLPFLVMDSIIDGTLPCLAKLPWLTQHVASIYAAFMTLNGPGHVLQGPFWWRLYRCSASDVAQLNTFHAYKTATDAAPSPELYSYALSIIIGSSEVYSFAGGPGGPLGLTYSEQVNRTARLFADASPQLVLSFARDVSKVPLYTPHPSTYRQFAHPSVPVLVLVGTLDPNTPHGLGPWFVNGLGSNATLVTVPYSAHGTVAYNAPCVNSIAFTFLLAFGASAPNTTCLTTIPAPDFDGLTSDVQALSLTYFNTTNLWNDEPPIPPFNPTPSPTPGVRPDANTTSTLGLEIAVGVLSATTLAFALVAFVLWRKRATNSAKPDYYENLRGSAQA